MGELLDRAFQKEVLNRLAEAYPNDRNTNDTFGSQDDSRLLVNIKYLEEHGLLKCVWANSFGGKAVVSAVITARGLDFLANDGGLSAILGVVTVRLDDETIRSLLIQRVEASEADPGTKAQIIDAIRGLPAEGLKAVAMRTIEAGLDHAPGFIDSIRGWLGA